MVDQDTQFLEPDEDLLNCEGIGLNPRIYSILSRRPHKRSRSDVCDLARHFRASPCFMFGLPLNGLEALCRRLSFAHVLPGNVLVRQGQPGDSMFMLISGTAQIFQRYGSLSPEHDHEVNDHGALIGSACYGSIVDMTNMAPASGAAQVAAALRAACCQRILETAPSDRGDADLQALVSFLRGLQAFKDFPLPLLKKLCRGMSLDSVKANAIVCEEDEPGDSMFILLSGVCEVRAQEPPEKLLLDDECNTVHPYTVGPNHIHRVRASTEELVHSVPSPEPAGTVERMAPRGSDATIWIEKFMKAAFHEKDPELMGHNNDMTPLAVIAAARWRKTLDDVQREQALQQEEADLAEAAQLQEEKARSEGMAALIGKAAAENWRRATFGDVVGGTMDWQRESLNVREQRTKALSLASDVHIDPDLHKVASTLEDPVEPCNEEHLAMHVEERTTGTDSLPAHRLYNPNKQKLADLCRVQPGHANIVLRRELSQRSQLDTVLSSMEKRIQRQGPAQRLGRRDSRRITRALNRAMLSGASRQVGSTRAPRLVREAHAQAARSDRGTDTNTYTGEFDDRRSSLEISERDSMEADNQSAILTDRSAISTGGESLDTQESFGWRMPHRGQDPATRTGPRRTSIGSIMMNLENAKEVYGPVIKKLLPGQSFGELALLQPNSLRTATVVAVPCQFESTAHACKSGFCGDEIQRHNIQGHTGSEHGTAGCAVMLLRLTQRLFDEAVTSLQVAQLEERLQFLMRFQAFKQLPRDRLTALLVFFRPETVPAGHVLAEQGSTADSVFLIEEGQVAYVMEGENMHNPMHPNCSKHREPIPGLPFVHSGSIPAMRMAVKKSDKRQFQKPRSRFSMLQLADKIHAADMVEEVENHDNLELDLAAKTVAKHWGAQKHKKHISPGVLGVIGQQASSAAHQYEARSVAGLELLSLGAGEMCGEQALGFRDPEASGSTQSRNDCKKFVQETENHRSAHALKPGCLQRKKNVQGTSYVKGQLMATAAEAKPGVYPATLVTVRHCRLLRINSENLLRFGTSVRDTIQLAAWRRRETLSNLSKQLSTVNDNLQVVLSSSRSMPESRNLMLPKHPQLHLRAPEYFGASSSSGGSHATGTGAGAAKVKENASKTVAGADQVYEPKLPRNVQQILTRSLIAGFRLSSRASWLPLPCSDSNLAGTHIRRVLPMPNGII